MCPLSFTKQCIKELTANTSAFRKENPIVDSDIQGTTASKLFSLSGLTAVVKHMPIVEKGEALRLLEKAQSCRDSNKLKILQQAVDRFEIASGAIPGENSRNFLIVVRSCDSALLWRLPLSSM